MVRVVIEADENVVELPSPEIAPPPEVANQYQDAGPAPAELLKRFGRVPPAENQGPSPPAPKAGRKVQATPGEAANPLRVGAAVARARLMETEAGRTEPGEAIDGGSAPKQSASQRRTHKQ